MLPNKKSHAAIQKWAIAHKESREKKEKEKEVAVQEKEKRRKYM
jgi:hypothetical protein